MLLREQEVLRGLLKTTKKMSYEVDIRTHKNKRYLIKIENMTGKCVIAWKCVRTRLRVRLHFFINPKIVILMTLESSLRIFDLTFTESEDNQEGYTK